MGVQEADDPAPVVVTPAKKVKREDVPESELDPATQELVALIFNEDMFNSAMADMELDVNKMPLGALSQTQVQKGYAVLAELECAPSPAAPLPALPTCAPCSALLVCAVHAVRLVARAASGDASRVLWVADQAGARAPALLRRTRDPVCDPAASPRGTVGRVRLGRGRLTTGGGCRTAVRASSRQEIERLTGRFYTVIPHSFGRQRPPLINTLDKVKTKFDMCNVLSDIETAQVRRPPACRSASSFATEVHREPARGG